MRDWLIKLLIGSTHFYCPEMDSYLPKDRISCADLDDEGDCPDSCPNKDSDCFVGVTNE